MTEPNFVLLLIGVIVVLAACSALAYYAGWRSARSYLGAAEAVTEMAKQAQADRAEFVAALDNTGGAAARLAEAVNAHAERTSGKLGAVEEALTVLFDGFERAGFAKRARPGVVGRQHGEAAPEDG